MPDVGFYSINQETFGRSIDAGRLDFEGNVAIHLTSMVKQSYQGVKVG